MCKCVLNTVIATQRDEKFWEAIIVSWDFFFLNNCISQFLLCQSCNHCSNMFVCICLMNLFITLWRDPQEFNISERLEYFANQWTPETGFEKEDLKTNRLGYPKPAAGNWNGIFKMPLIMFGTFIFALWIYNLRYRHWFGIDHSIGCWH